MTDPSRMDFTYALTLPILLWKMQQVTIVRHLYHNIFVGRPGKRFTGRHTSVVNSLEQKSPFLSYTRINVNVDCSSKCSDALTKANPGYSNP